MDRIGLRYFITSMVPMGYKDTGMYFMMHLRNVSYHTTAKTDMWRNGTTYLHTSMHNGTHVEF